MNSRALKLKKQETAIEQRTVNLQIVHIAHRKTALEAQIAKLDRNGEVLESQSRLGSNSSRLNNLVRLFTYRSWCDGLLQQSEKHQQDLRMRASAEESRLTQAIHHLKQLKDKEGVLEEFLKKDLRFKLAECRANDESAIEELAMACIARGLA